MHEKIILISVEERILKVIKKILYGNIKFERLEIKYINDEIIPYNEDIQFFFVGCNYKCRLHPCLKKFVFLSENKQIPFLIICPLALSMRDQFSDSFLFSLYENCTLTSTQEKIIKQMKMWVNHSLFSGIRVHPTNPISKILEVQRRIVSSSQERESLLSLAASMDISPSWLSFKFGEISGVTLEKFKLRKKFCYSLWQIVSTQKPIKTIAFDLGYKPLSFTKRFHAFFGVPPSAIRRKLSSLLI